MCSLCLNIDTAKLLILVWHGIVHPMPPTGLNVIFYAEQMVAWHCWHYMYLEMLCNTINDALLNDKSLHKIQNSQLRQFNSKLHCSGASVVFPLLWIQLLKYKVFRYVVIYVCKESSIAASSITL